MSKKPRAIHFGAGNIGRGFIAPLLSRSGYHVVFTDVDKNLIDTINDEKAYGVHILASESHEVEEVIHVKGVLSTTDDLIHELAHPKLRLVTTAVGLHVLDKIAPALASGIKARRATNGAPINIIACENAIAATAQLEAKVRAHLDGADAEYATTHVGFANCSVDRIVPPFDPDAHGADSALDVGVEAFFEWVVEGPALKGPDAHAKGGALEPPVHGMALADDLAPYNERKLFTLNAGHAAAAYLGHLLALRTVAQAIADPRVAAVVRGALHEESGKALCRKHRFAEATHGKYIEAILARFANEAVQDHVARVGRAPLRKLGRGDRLVGPARMCTEYGIRVPHLATAIAAALWYDDPADEDSVAMRGAIGEKGVGPYVAELTGFEDGHEVHILIVEKYKELEGWKVKA
ncbi:mannitol-1-phosphate 5-dehydrogenase [Mycena belliarum]|uniref:Mannitol-1-phosphate 5-dehydrogenase n=1 Tax=Mycena belliarum TaxID=1033014 RepID=A0AAD6U4K4_9AGAR|nr:mannitol-1-phosphate 5-dehydrogenase [Mycena belliae]